MAEAVATTSGLEQNAHVHWPFAGIATGAPAQRDWPGWRQLVYAGVAWLGDCKQGGSGVQHDT
ncbi:hypothetical protein HaLaN_06393, partial [Haematococcus lacustris]